MTTTFKENILKYVTGNITPGEEQANAFRDNEETQTSIIDALSEKGITATHFSILTTSTTSNYLIYGGYTSGGVAKGFIVILDQKGNILDIITQYDSGVDLQYLYYLDYDENGTIYGIDEAPSYPSNLRIVLFNNIALETPRGYYCKLRSSYYIGQSSYTTPTADRFDIPWQDYSMPHIIKKVPGEPVYFIFGSIGGTNSCLIKFVNNVGMPNEWYTYRGHALDQNTSYIFRSDMQVEKSGDDYLAYIYYNDYDAKLLKYEYFNGSSLIGYQEQSFNDPIMCIRVFDKDTTFFTTRHNNNDNTYSMKLYKLDNDITSNIVEFTFTTTTPSFNLCIDNNALYGIAMGYTTSGSSFQYNYVCVAYANNNIVISNVLSFEPNQAMEFNTAVQSSFALHKFVILSSDSIYHPSVVIYDNMYSGSAYEGYGLASPQKGELYSNGYIAFARGIYNKQIFNNQTTTTIEVPNGYLNDSTITQTNVLSKSNNVLIQDNTSINKNIYETLFLNFTNSISVIDEDTNNAYPDTAIYINANTNIGEEENYNNTFLGKLRIRYDDHVVVQPITWTQIDGTHYQMTTIIDNSTPIKTLEYLSNDESTIYMTKSNFELLGTYFKLTQKIRIE